MNKYLSFENVVVVRSYHDDINVIVITSLTSVHLLELPGKYMFIIPKNFSRICKRILVQFQASLKYFRGMKISSQFVASAALIGTRCPMHD